jgi:hypothetical protein
MHLQTLSFDELSNAKVVSIKKDNDSLSTPLNSNTLTKLSSL